MRTISEIERAIHSCQNKITKYKKSLAGANFHRTETINAISLEQVKIAALREQQRREQGCEYCNTENKFTETGVSIISTPYLSVHIAKAPFENIFFLMISEYRELSNMRGMYDNSPFRSDKKRIYVCPMCGRKLGERHE